MSLIHSILRYQQLHQLIEKSGTGTAKQLAQKLGITERQVYYYLQELREMGLPIAYDTIRQNCSFFYRRC